MKGRSPKEISLPMEPRTGLCEEETAGEDTLGNFLIEEDELVSFELPLLLLFHLFNMVAAAPSW